MIETLEKNIDKDIRKQLETLADAVAGLGFSFTVYADDAEILMNRSAGFKQTDYDKIFGQIKNIFETNNPDTTCHLSQNHIHTIPLDWGQQYKVLAVLENQDNEDERAGLICQLVETVAKSINHSAKAERQIELISTELSETYEELSLLYKMSSNMKVSQADSNYLQLACDWLMELVNVEGIAIITEKQIDRQKKFILTAGTGIIDINQQQIELIQARLLEQISNGRDALLDSDVDSPFTYSWPERIRNIIVVPFEINNRITGFLVAINRLDKPDFDSTDVKLFNTVARQCAIFIQNGLLFRDLKSLFVGSLKALTMSIDAKDQYTRGHSERVAFIAKWIAEKYAETEQMDPEYIHRIYLAGLLHDIGKIGIPESVLRKNGKLTDEEMNTIKSHPSIGASILAEIKQMEGIIPGVLSHHERVDGKGYPNRLNGNQIHLIGKVVSIADSFDAMTSRRIYREAMSIESAVEQIKKGIGTQFDEKIANAFLSSDIHALWEILQDGTSPVWGHSDIIEYSTEAVGVLVG